MSQVFSFRLNTNNPREAQALEIIKAWTNRGYNTRFIITEALINMEKGGINTISKLDVEEINSALEKITQLLIKTEANKNLYPSGQCENQGVPNLNSEFLNSIKMNVKTGLKLEPGVF